MLKIIQKIYENKEIYLLSNYTTYQTLKNVKINKNFTFFNGKPFCKDLINNLISNPIIHEKLFCNILGISCGYGIQNPCVCFITDSIITSGLFYESLIFLKTQKPKVVVIMDFNSEFRNSKNPLKIKEFSNLLKSLKIDFKICNAYETLEINEIEKPIFYIFKTFKGFKNKNLKYLNVKNYEKLNYQDYLNLQKFFKNTLGLYP